MGFSCVVTFEDGSSYTWAWAHKGAEGKYTSGWFFVDAGWGEEDEDKRLFIYSHGFEFQTEKNLECFTVRGGSVGAKPELAIDAYNLLPPPPIPDYMTLGGIALGTMALSAIATYTHEKGLWKFPWE